MKENLIGSLWRLLIYAVICSLLGAVLVLVMGQIRFQDTQSYYAVFANVSGLKDGSFVRVGGVEVGQVEKVIVQPDSTVRVEFTADDTVVLTAGNRAIIRYDDLIGGRYMALEEGSGGVKKLNPGGTIPMSQTAPALDLDALIGGFKPLFRVLKPEQINDLTGQIVGAFQGQGGTIGSILSQTAALTNTLADRDELIGQVVTNLNTLLGSLGDQSDEFAKTVDSLSNLLDTLSARKTDISNGLAYTNKAAASIADLLTQSRPDIKKVVTETDRTAGVIVADHDFVDNLLNTLPDAYQILYRQGLYGDFFNFYICDLFLKVNGKNGQPAYVKLAGQSSGRCEPR
jgi:phospholipid/cholesterol/gamma-HCH transport system substrate-binding protein